MMGLSDLRCTGAAAASWRLQVQIGPRALLSSCQSADSKIVKLPSNVMCPFHLVP